MAMTLAYNKSGRLENIRLPELYSHLPDFLESVPVRLLKKIGLLELYNHLLDLSEKVPARSLLKSAAPTLRISWSRNS